MKKHLMVGVRLLLVFCETYFKCIDGSKEIDIELVIYCSKVKFWKCYSSNDW